MKEGTYKHPYQVTKRNFKTSSRKMSDNPTISDGIEVSKNSISDSDQNEYFNGREVVHSVSWRFLAKKMGIPALELMRIMQIHLSVVVKNANNYGTAGLSYFFTLRSEYTKVLKSRRARKTGNLGIMKNDMQSITDTINVGLDASIAMTLLQMTPKEYAEHINNVRATLAWTYHCARCDPD